MNIILSIPVKRITYFLLMIIIFLSTASLVVTIVPTFVFQDEFAARRTLVGYFLLDKEGNLPTYFQVTLLTLNSIVLFIIAYRSRVLKQKHFIFWLMLSFIFLFLSLDEFTRLHERLTEPTRALLDTSGIFYYAWIVPVGILIIIIGLAYLPFLYKLPSHTRKLIILAGVVYIGGAMGMEAVASLRISYLEALNISIENIIEKDIFYILVATLEETLEMLGALILFYGLNMHIFKYKNYQTVYTPHKADSTHSRMHSPN